MFENIIAHYPDFPKPGIDFIDVLPFLADHEAFKAVINQIDSLCTAPNATAIEARGFLFTAPLLTVSTHVRHLFPVRKRGKIPYSDGDLCRVEIKKEYGSDELFFRHSDMQRLKAEDGCVRISLIDDFLATGGTALDLARALQANSPNGMRVEIAEFVFLAELAALDGRKALEQIAPVHTLMQI